MYISVDLGVNQHRLFFHFQLGCCGVNGYKDYSSLPEAKQKKVSVIARFEMKFFFHFIFFNSDFNSCLG